MWVFGFVFFSLLGAAMERRRQARRLRERRRWTRWANYRARQEWEDKIFGAQRWFTLFLGTLIIASVAYMYWEFGGEGSSSIRTIRAVLIAIGLGTGSLGAWLGERIDLLIALLRNDSAGHERHGPHRDRRRLGGVALWSGISLSYLSSTVGIGLGAFGTLGESIGVFAALLPDVVACGMGMVAVGLGLKSFDFVMSLKPSDHVPGVRDDASIR
jgi:hypothetical protein